ncbi:MAG: phosphatase PAP2 family protein, partial [Aeromicrobium sp.]
SRRTLVIAVALAATVLGVGIPMLAGGATPTLSATGRVKASPPPALFGDKDVATIASPIAEQTTRAKALMATWWKAHGKVRDDAAFISWVETQVPAPPSADQRRKELETVKALDRKRTPAGVAAATWLETYGKKDIWKVYLHDQRELQPPATGTAEKVQLKAILTMSKTVADALGTKYQQSAPYVLDPALRTDHVVKKGAVCPCSYPSRHATRAAGSRTYLGYLAPRRVSDYQWMEAEVAYSRLYMAGHVESDITAGSLLGDMIGEYILVTSGKEPVPS